MSKAIDDVIAERRRQIEEEGWTAEHDDTHCCGELARAAACFAYGSTLGGQERLLHKQTEGHLRDGVVSAFMLIWPGPWDRVWFKLKDPRRDLVRAGALIIAEIERLDRQASD